MRLDQLRDAERAQGPPARSRGEVWAAVCTSLRGGATPIVDAPPLPAKAAGVGVWLWLALALVGVAALVWLSWPSPTRAVGLGFADATAPQIAESAATVSPTPPPAPDPDPPLQGQAEPQPAKPTTERKAPGNAPARAPSEYELIRRAQVAARAGRYGEARRWLDRHARRFARGTLVEDREALRAVVQCKATDAPQRGRALARFTAAYPSSIHRERVERACADH